LGLVPDCAVLPHFDTFGRLWLESATDTMPTPEITLLGLDERTAVVWDGQRWVVAGPGAVTVVAMGHRSLVFRDGDTAAGIEPPVL
jgi:cyanophycinase-like exopeptidase